MNPSPGWYCPDCGSYNNPGEKACRYCTEQKQKK